MNAQQKPRRQFATVLPVVVAVGCAVVTLLLWIFAPLSLLTAFVGLLVSALLGISTWLLLRRPDDGTRGDLFGALMTLASDKDIAPLHEQIVAALCKVSERRDPIYQTLARQRLESIVGDCNLLGDGRIEFESTETWRLLYEQLLRSPGLHLYRSVAYVETPHYWQDGPGQQSTQLNLELQDAGTLSIERTVIVADHLWGEDPLFPVEPIHSWIDEQHRHGIWLRLVREASLDSEPELLSDFGIYGSRALGMQRLDAAGRTARFVLSFDFEEVKRAEQWWDRLAVYATSYRDLLDQKH